MSNYIEYNDKIAFHPGYYIKEIIEESGLSQKDFAKRLDTTPKNLSILVRGEQSLSIDIAMKLSRMLGTSVDYWLNLQKSYDALIAEFESSKELEQERRIFKYFQYTYFRENFGLPDLPRKTNEQIKCLREFLNVASLSVFTKQNMTVSFVRMNEFSENAIRRFAERIDRDPGIVLGRLQNDQIVPFTNVALSKALKHKYKVITS